MRNKQLDLVFGLSSIWESCKLRFFLDPDVDSSRAINYLEELSEVSISSLTNSPDPICIQLAHDLHKLLFQAQYPLQQCPICDTPLIGTPYLYAFKDDNSSISEYVHRGDEPDPYLYCANRSHHSNYRSGSSFSKEREGIPCSLDTFYQVESSNIRVRLALCLFKVFIIDNSKKFSSALHTEDSLRQWNKLAKLRAKCLSSISSPWAKYKDRIGGRLLEALEPALQNLRTFQIPSITESEGKVQQCAICKQEPVSWEGPHIEYVPLSDILQVKITSAFRCAENHKWSAVLATRDILIECDLSSYSSAKKISFKKNDPGNIDLFISCQCATPKRTDELTVFGVNTFLGRILLPRYWSYSYSHRSFALQDYTTPAFVSLEAIRLTPDGLTFRVSKPELWLSITDI